MGVSIERQFAPNSLSGVLYNMSDIGTYRLSIDSVTNYSHSFFVLDGGFVLNLEKDTFDSHLIDSERSWFVLFYVSWCGHCIDYVPIYLSIAKALRGESYLELMLYTISMLSGQISLQVLV